MLERNIPENTMEKTDKPKGEFQTSEKFRKVGLAIGCTVGSDCTLQKIKELKSLGVKYFQVLADFSYVTGQYKPPIALLSAIGNCKVVLHMPFYFHLLQKPTNKFRSYFQKLDAYWQDKQKLTMLVAHCKGIHKNVATTNNMLYEHTKYYSRACPRIKILMENDAGGKTNPAPKLRDIVSVKERLNKNKLKAGLCVDTEHAYAAGDELFSVNYRSSISMIHLNAIPKNVMFGGHLDRHSHTPLIESKNGTSFIKKILSVIRKSTPIILERMDYNITIKDIKLLKAITNENLFHVDKKTVGKAILKGRKVFY